MTEVVIQPPDPNYVPRFVSEEEAKYLLYLDHMAKYEIPQPNVSQMNPRHAQIMWDWRQRCMARAANNFHDKYPHVSALGAVKDLKGLLGVK